MVTKPRHPSVLTPFCAVNLMRLMEQAEEAGAQLITGIRVDNLVQRDGKVVGVEADGDVIEAKTVILADGVNSILAEKLGMANASNRRMWRLA